MQSQFKTLEMLDSALGSGGNIYKITQAKEGEGEIDDKEKEKEYRGKVDGAIVRADVEKTVGMP